MKKNVQKPNRILFDTVVGTNMWSKGKSFYVGDALGRPNDWSDSDKAFAQNVGIKVFAPEDIFPYTKQKNDTSIKPRSNQEVVIMVGYPGSGKSTLAEQVFGNTDRYKILHGDNFKTSARIIKEGTKYLQNGYSVVIDAINPSKEKRKEYIKLAKMFKVKTLVYTLLHHLMNHFTETTNDLNQFPR